MTAPDKIWHEIVTAKDMDELYGFGISPDDWNAANFEEYTRADLAQAAVAAAYEAAAQAVGWEAYVADTSPQYLSDWQRGLVAGQQAMSKAIRALATPDQIAALAAKVDASQAPNPAVNGGRCQSDTIPLPRAEVEDVADTLNLVADWMEKSVKDRRIIGPEFHVPTLRKALTALQERMK